MDYSNRMPMPFFENQLIKMLRKDLRNTSVAVNEIDDVVIQFGTDWSGDPATYVDVVLNVKNEANWQYSTYLLVEKALGQVVRKLAPDNLVYFSFIDKTDLPKKFPELVKA